MTLGPEVPRGKGAFAFGLDLTAGPGLEMPGLHLGPVPAGMPGTSIRVANGDIGPIEPGGKRVRTFGVPEAPELTIDLQVGRGYVLSTQAHGRYLVSLDGAEIHCVLPAEGNDWRPLVIGQVLPLAATLRGLEVFHASGVVMGERAMLFSGAPGVGKSSLALRLVLHGASLLSDDAVALDDALIAHPGSALLKIRPAELALMSEAERTSLAETPSPDRTGFLATAARPAPVGDVFLLERAADGPWIERLEAVDPFALIAATFNLSVRTPARLVRQLDRCAALAARVAIHRVRITPDLTAEALASRLMAGAQA